MMRYVWAAVLAATLMLGGAGWAGDWDVDDGTDHYIGGTDTDGVSEGPLTGNSVVSSGALYLDEDQGGNSDSSGAATIRGTGTLAVTGTGALVIGDLGAGELTNEGELTNASGTTINIGGSGALINKGKMVTGGSVQNVGAITNTGTWVASMTVSGGGAIRNNADGEITFEDATTTNDVFNNARINITGTNKIEDVLGGANVYGTTSVITIDNAEGVFTEVDKGKVVLTGSKNYTFADLGTPGAGIVFETGRATGFTGAVNMGANAEGVTVGSSLTDITTPDDFTFGGDVTAAKVKVEGTGKTVTFSGAVAADVTAGTGNTLDLNLATLTGGADIKNATLKTGAAGLTQANVNKLTTDGGSVIDVTSEAIQGVAGQTVDFGTLNELRTGTIETFNGGVTVAGAIAVGKGSAPTAATGVTFNENVSATAITYNGAVNNIVFNGAVAVGPSGLNVGNSKTATFGQAASVTNANSVINDGTVLLHAGNTANRAGILGSITNNGVIAFNGDTTVNGDVTIQGGIHETVAVETYTGKVTVNNGGLVIGSATSPAVSAKTTFQDAVKADTVSFGANSGNTVVFEDNLNIATAVDLAIGAGKTVSFKDAGNMTGTTGGLRFDGGTLSMGAELTTANAGSVFDGIKAGGAGTGLIVFDTTSGTEVGYAVKNTLAGVATETGTATKIGGGGEAFDTAGAVILGSNTGASAAALEVDGSVAAGSMGFGANDSPGAVSFNGTITLTGANPGDKVFIVVDGAGKTIDFTDGSGFGAGTTMTNGSGNNVAIDAAGNLSNLLAGITNNGSLSLYNAAVVTDDINIGGTGDFETHKTETYKGLVTVADGGLVLGSASKTDSNANLLTFEKDVNAKTITFGAGSGPASAAFEGSVKIGGNTDLDIGADKTVLFQGANAKMAADTVGGLDVDGTLSLGTDLTSANAASIFGKINDGAGVFTFHDSASNGGVVGYAVDNTVGALTGETRGATKFEQSFSTAGELVLGSDAASVVSADALEFAGAVKAETIKFGSNASGDNSPDLVKFGGEVTLTSATAADRVINVAAGKTVMFDANASLGVGTKYKNDGAVRLANNNADIAALLDGETGGTTGVFQFVKGAGAADSTVTADIAYTGTLDIETMDMTEFSGDNSTTGTLVFGSNTTAIPSGSMPSELVFSGDITAKSMEFGAIGADDNSPAKVTFKKNLEIAAGNPLAIGSGKTVKFDSEASLATDTQYKNDGVVELANNLADLDDFLEAESGGTTAGVIRFVKGSVDGRTTVSGNIAYNGNNTVETGEMALISGGVDVNGSLVFGSNSNTIDATPALVFEDSVSAAKMAFGTDANSPDTVSFGGEMSVVSSEGLVVGDGKTVNFGIPAGGGYVGGGIYARIDVQGGTANFHVDVDDLSGLELNVQDSGGAHVFADVTGALTMDTGVLHIDGAAASFTDTNTGAFTLGSASTTRDSLVWLENGGTADFSSRSGFTVAKSGAISGDGTFVLGSGKTLAVNGAIESFGKGLKITAAAADIAGTVIFGVNGLSGADERFAAVAVSGDVNFKSGSTLQLSGEAITYINRVYAAAGYNPENPFNPALPAVDEPLYGEVLLTADGDINVFDSGWTSEYGVVKFVQDSVDYYYTLQMDPSTGDNEIVFGGRETIRGDNHDKLTGYWKRREGVDIGGLVTRNGANVLADTASAIAALGPDYYPQESQILYLSGKWGKSGLLGGFGTQSAFNYEFGQAYTKPVNISIDNIRHVFDELAKFEPVWDMADHAGYQGASVGSERGYAARSFDCAPGGGNNGFFAGGIGLWQDLDNKDNGAGGYKYNSGGVLAGYSHRFGGLTASAAFAYNGGVYKDTLAYANDSKIDNYTFLLDFKYKHRSGFFAALGGGYAYSHYSLRGLTDKVVDISAGTVARGWDRAKYHANTWLVDLDLGYELRPTACFAIIPSIGLSYVNASANDFTARWRGTDAVGTAYNQANRVRDLDGHSLQLPVDLTLAYDVPLGVDSKFRVMVNGGYAYEFHNEGVDGTLSWGGIAGNPSVRIRDREPGRNTWNVGAGLQYTRGNFDFSAKYDYYSRSKLDAHRVVGTIGIKF